MLIVLGIFLFSGCTLFGASEPAPENNAVDVRPQGYEPPDNGDVPEFDTSKPGAVEQTTFAMTEIARPTTIFESWPQLSRCWLLPNLNQSSPFIGGETFLFNKSFL